MKPQFEKIPYAEGSSFACLRFEGERCSNPLHLHPEYEMACFVHGSGHWMVGDAMGEIMDGSLMFIGSGLPHLFKVHPADNRPQRVNVLQFGRDCLGADFFAKSESRHLQQFLELSQRGILFGAQTATQLHAGLEQLLRLPAQARLLPFLQLLETAAQSRDFRLLASAGYSPLLLPAQASRINKAIDYISLRLNQQIYLGEVARVVGLSEAAFSRFFRKAVTRTFSEFLNELRISMACRQLLETDKTITEIAYDCGFNNLSNFNRRFSALRGSTPTAFRRRHRQLIGK